MSRDLGECLPVSVFDIVEQAGDERFKEPVVSSLLIHFSPSQNPVELLLYLQPQSAR